MNRHFRTWLFLMSVLALHATLIYCTEVASSPMVARKDPLPDESQQGYRMVKRLAKQFSINFFKKMTLWEPNSVVLSPLNFFLLLSMLSYGAQGREKNFFLSAIGLSENDTRIAQYGYKRLINKLSHYNMRMSTKLYYTASSRPVPSFIRFAEDVFKADVERVSVHNHYIGSKKINDWVKNQTDRACKKMFKNPLRIGPKPSFVLVNTVYFKGVFESPFVQSHTVYRPFYLFNKGALYVPTMHKFDLMPYGRIEAIRANFVELAFKSNGAYDAMSMFIILPDEQQSTIAIMNDLDKFKLNDLFNYTLRNVNLHLPKFKFEYSQPLFSRTLDRVLGESHPFKIQSTFNNMIAGSKSMSFGNGVVKYVIEIDENGDKTTGLSGAFYNEKEAPKVNRTGRSVEGTPTFVEFNANHSFIAIIATRGEVFIDLFTVICNGFNFLRR